MSLIDFKSAAAGEKKAEVIGRGLEPEELESIFAAPEAVNEADEPAPTFKDQPWPNEEVESSGPEISGEQDVMTLVQKASKPMIDSSMEPKTLIHRRVCGEPSPSDREWARTIKEILRPAEAQEIVLDNTTLRRKNGHH